MAHLSYSSPDEVQLRLGAHEQAILTVVRRWAWWTRAVVEGQVAGHAEVTAVVLTAQRSTEKTIRDILRLSFRLVFPAEGGEGVAAQAAPPITSARRGR